ncbi:MAG: DUF4411 family protein [Candidatus Eisenbacteria bacterium]|nr:DUF4411 family protein [Candidatus Eisenbacteria bacterium]
MSAAPGEPDQRVYIIDTSSILEARRLLAQAPLTDLKRVYKALAGLVEQGVLRYPAEVYEELLRGHEMVGDGDDVPFEWAEQTRDKAVPEARIYDQVREVLAVAPMLIDVENTTGREEADPYVVGLAMAARDEGRRVVVVTEDRRDREFKTSVQSACGLMDIPAISMRVFLARARIWPRS